MKKRDPVLDRKTGHIPDLRLRQNHKCTRESCRLERLAVSMSKIPTDDVLESLYKLRIRESEKLKTVLELYDLEIHQKKLGPDYHRLKTMVKRSIEQNLRNRKETEIMTETLCKQYTSHVTFFSCLRASVIICHTTLAQGSRC